MVKVKPAMSTDSSEGESDALAAVKDKLKIQQRLIDISARSLLASRSSSADLSQSFESQSALEVQKENIALLEVCRQASREASNQRALFETVEKAMEIRIGTEEERERERERGGMGGKKINPLFKVDQSDFVETILIIERCLGAA